MSADSYIYREEPGSPGAPLLFTFHGTGGDENQFTELARQLLPEATIISPRGDVSEHGAARFFRRTGEGMYDMADLERATHKMAGFVSTGIERIKPSHVFALGYSNGANILASVLFTQPQLFDASVLMHPLIPFEPAGGDLGGRQVLITAGRRDPICPPVLTSRLEAWLRENGADLEIEWHEGGHEIRQNELEAAHRFLGSASQKGAEA